MLQGEDVTLVGDFTGNWKEPLKAKFQGGSRHEAEVKLPQGKYVLNLLIFFFFCRLSLCFFFLNLMTQLAKISASNF